MAKQQLLLALILAMAASSMATYIECDKRDHNKCLSKSTFCWHSRVYECANRDFECKGMGPCVARSEYPRLPGSWKRYQCLNNLDFANGPNVKRCAPGTQCWVVPRGQSPCLSKKHRGECPNENGGCVDSTTYCENGMMYRCPSGLMCAGDAESPLGIPRGVVAPCAKKLRMPK